MIKDVLLVGSDHTDLTAAKKVLEDYSFTVDIVYTGSGAIKRTQCPGYFVVVICDDLEDKTAKELLEKLMNVSPYTEYIIYSSDTNFSHAKELVNLGATGFATKGDYSELKMVLERKRGLTVNDMNYF